VKKLSTFLLAIITLVSSANEMVSDKVYIVGGRSFINIMKRKGPRIDPSGAPCCTAPHFEENFCNDFICFFFFVLFCFLSDMIHVNLLATTPRMPQ
jgi:hypothetical protein